MLIVGVPMKPQGAQEVGHMYLQPFDECISLNPSNVFIQIHFNIIILAVPQH